MPTTRIIGAITVTVKCIDPTGNGLQKVVFKVDDVAVGIDSTPTFDGEYYWFEWLCGDELPTGEHELKVVAFDTLGNSQEKSITVLKGLVLKGVVEYSAYLEVTESLELEGLEVVEMQGFYTLILEENYQTSNY
jgi:hypothetical protein